MSSLLPLARENGSVDGGASPREAGNDERGNEEPRRGERKGERDYPDIHRTLFFILHYPCSTPLYSIMPAPRINDESYPRPPDPPGANHRMSIRLLVVLCLAVCNSDKHQPERGDSVIEWEKYTALCGPLHNPRQTSLRCMSFDWCESWRRSRLFVSRIIRECLLKIIYCLFKLRKLTLRFIFAEHCDEYIFSVIILHHCVCAQSLII